MILFSKHVVNKDVIAVSLGQMFNETLTVRDINMTPTRKIW